MTDLVRLLGVKPKASQPKHPIEAITFKFKGRTWRVKVLMGEAPPALNQTRVYNGPETERLDKFTKGSQYAYMRDPEEVVKARFSYTDEPGCSPAPQYKKRLHSPSTILVQFVEVV